MEELNGANESVKVTLSNLWRDNKILASVILVLVILGTLAVLGWFGYGMFKALKGSEYMDATSVPADVNAWKSRGPGTSDRFAQDFSGTNQGGQNLSLTTTEVGSRDGLTVTRGNGPDFWEISSMLGDYQSAAGKASDSASLYWSPDLSAYISEEEAMSLSADQRARLAVLSPGAQSAPAAAAKAEYMRANQNALLTERFRENANALLSPEERMLSENFALLPEVRTSENFGALLSADKALYQRAGVY